MTERPEDPFTPPAPEVGTPPPPRYGEAFSPPGYPHPTGATGRNNGLGLAAMIIGIIGLVLSLLVVGIIGDVLAIVFGIIGRRRVRRGEAGNGGQALAGIITGAIGAVLAIVVGVLVALLVNSDSVQNYIDCLDRATTQHEQDACADQLSHDLTG